MKKRILCIILTLVMLMGLLPAGVSAATPEKAAGGVSIDFTNPADAGKFIVDNQTDSEIKEGEGFYMISTNESFEDCKGQLSGDAATTPRDAIQVPVAGDWTATLSLKVDTSGSNGQYEFICLYGMADYDNGCGIRAGNGSTVNYKEVDGVNESSIDGMKVQTGLTSGADHWYRLEKVGTTYTGYLSEDGEEYQKVFTYEDTGIEAKMIVIDAYSGRSVGYQYWLQSLEIEGGEPAQAPYSLTDSIEIGKTYVIVADGQYALTNRQEGPALRTYAGSATTTLASAPVTVENGVITSAVTDDMLWTVEESTAAAAYDGVAQYFLKDAAGNYLRRGSGSSGQGAQLLAEPNLYSTIRYNAWSFYPYEGENAFAMYANSERSYGTDYPFYVYGNETSFDSPGRAQREEADPFAFTRNDDCSHIQLFEVDGEVAPPCEHEYTAVVTEPTCTAKGYTTYTCSKCGDSYVGDTVKALGHDYVDGVCTRCGKEDPNKPVLVYAEAGSFEVGKTYVIVADGKYALNNESVDLGSYSNSTTNSLGATEVSIEGGVIVSDVPASILWTFQEPGDIEPATDGQPMYFVTDAEGRYLRRRSGSTATAPLEVGAELASSIQYNTWSVWPYDDGTFAIYSNSYRGERSSDTTQYQDYPFHLYGRAEGFDAPGEARYFENPFDFVNASNCSHLQLFELTTAGTVTDVIDFTTEADAGKYDIVGQTQSSVEEGVGLALICTRKSIEPAKRPNTAEYIGAEDTVEIPLEDGDFTATLNFDYDPNNGGGAYAFFSFFASEGDDYNNMLGIRGGDGAMQNFERHDGAVTHEDEADVNSAPGFSEAGEFWFRIERTGSTYVCYRSADGETFDQMFSYEDSDIDATKLIIDAYSASSSGNGRKFILKTLTIERESGACQHEYVDVVVEPTCYERGYTEHTCAKCGRVYRSDFVDKLEHVWDESKTVVVPPTCTEQGYTERTCSRCGDSFQFDFVYELLHDWPKEGVVTKQATETERGELTFTCTRCGATKTRPTAAGTEKAHKNEILFISDVHSARKAEDGFHNLRAMFRLLRENDNFVPEVVSGGGDYIESSTNDNADWPHSYEVMHDIMYNTSPDTYQTLGSGNHEWEWSRQSEEMIEKLLGEPRVGIGYESDDYAIFHVGAHMNGTGQEEFFDADIDKLIEFLDSQVGNGKVIFVQTHWPLHYAYNWAWRTTKNAARMIDVLNSYTDKMDICFVWGHNHHQDAMRHQFKGRGDVLQISETESKKILFNYFNAGCLNENAAEQDAGPSGSDYGPGYLLECRLEGDKLILDYGHITGAYPDPDQAKFDHNADLLYVEEIQEARESHHEVQLLRHGDCEHDYVETKVEPTCTMAGYSTFICSKCGVSYCDDTADALGHTWDEGKVTTASTAATQGIKTFTCTVCGATKTQRLPTTNASVPDSIDFANGGGYMILGPTEGGAAQTENGLVIKTTRNAVEPCNGQNSGAQATTPEDMIEIPAAGDWTAVLRFGFEPTAANGYYQFFGFFAAQGDDFQNMAGVRGGDKALQNFLRVGGEITADTDGVTSAPGLVDTKDYFVRIDKTGDDYSCYRSDDGEDWTEMFSYADTGIEADRLLIDAYTGMTAGYTFTLENLEFAELGIYGACEHDFKDTVTAPGCLAKGYTTRTCTKCGKSEIVDEVKPLGHEFVDGVCSRCGAKSSTYVEPVSYDALNAAIAEAEAVDKTKFTDETVAALEQALEAAKAARTADSQGAVELARFNLISAYSGLKAKDPFRFDDVKDESQYYFDPVYWAVDNGITTGATPTTFNPGAGCTRAQVVTFLWRAAGKPEPTKAENPFDDVKSDAYYYKAVLWAVEKGITKGTSDTRFSPESTCTRGQIVTFLWRYNGQPKPGKSDNPFEDVKAGEYYTDAVLWAVEKGITKGTSDTRFSPNSTCTRGQIVTFLYRAEQE